MRPSCVTRLSLPYRALDLCAETGELAQEILRDSGYGKRGAARPSERTVAELGDSLFSCCAWRTR